MMFYRKNALLDGVHRKNIGLITHIYGAKKQLIIGAIEFFFQEMSCIKTCFE